MDQHCHQYQQHDNIWLSVAHLPPPLIFPATSPWEQRHRQEFALREALYTTYNNTQHRSSKNANIHNGLNSGLSESYRPQPQTSAFQLTPIREADLVGRCLYALQGVPVAVNQLRLLANLFIGQIADRSLHRLPSLWQRSSSTKALGKMLSVIAQAGWVRCQLEEFVHFFFNLQTQQAAISQLHTDFEMQPGSLGLRQEKKGKKKSRHQQKVITSREEELKLSPPYSLVNQAFAKAVKSILQGHLAALNALTDSVLLRRSSNGSDSTDIQSSDKHVGAVIGLPSCDMTLLELYLHTDILRIQLQALASICLCKGSIDAGAIQEWDEHAGWGTGKDSVACEASSDSGIRDFSSFPRGADLLTFLYRQLQEASDVHVELLRYLFSCACQPYLVLVHSWLYCATIRDPYGEFLIQEANSITSAGLRCQITDSVSAPCFLEDVCIPLIRCGQQLQVLSKLVETGVANASYNKASCISNGFKMLEGALKAWNELANENSIFFPLLLFDKEELDELVEERKQKRHILMQDFDTLFSNLHSQADSLQFQAGSNMLNFKQVNAQSVSSGTNAPTSKPFVVQNMAGVLGRFFLDGKPRTVEEAQKNNNIFMPMEIVSESSSHSALPEEVGGFGDKMQQYELGSLESSRRTEIMGGEISVSFEAKENDTFFPDSNKDSKQRKKWTEPTEVVIVHGRPDEEAILVNQPPEEDLDLCDGVHHISDHEVELGTFCNELAEGDWFDLSILGNVLSPSYSLPPFTQASLWSEMNFNSQIDDPSLQSLTVAGTRNSGNLSFFFSNVCLEEVGPDIFGHSYIHKLVQSYKNSSPLQNDGYKRSVTNFDAVSHKFWNFEDCIGNRSSYMKVLPPSFLFTAASNAVETVSYDNRVIYLPHSENQNESGNVNTEDRLYKGSRKNLSYFFAASSLSEGPPLGSSKVEPLVMSRAETPVEGFEENKTLELLCRTSKRGQGTVCGGATWQSYLGLRGHEDLGSVAVSKRALESTEIPLEVIVEKCLIQEVLSQYECISHFTVRLLHEVFGVQDHLAALRRYFFMERGDWADIFTSALYHHAWHPRGSLQRQLEVQTLLETAVQNSSCQEDDYAERLHVHVERDGDGCQSDADNLGHIYINKTSLCAFDFITLGYRLEWPVSLIITSESLKVYNSTFNFLVRAKLAAHAVNDIWKFLKDLLHASRKDDTLQRAQWINMLILFRQQINHFVTTLQGHIETQLLHNVWCRFLEALNHEGKDLVDLETIHGLYLRDALHVCFLSDEMKPVKHCVDDIMQCLLDLSACLNILGKQQNGNPTLESEKVQSAILQAKNCFESSVRQLLQIALNKHNHFSLSQFWTCLDFNGFFDSIYLNYS